MRANRRFLCGGVPYTTFLCCRGWCTLTLLMFQVWTWISHFPRRRISVYFPSLRYLFCNSAVAAPRYVAWVAAAVRSVALQTQPEYLSYDSDCHLGLFRVKNWNGSQQAPSIASNGKVEFCIQFGISSQGLHFPEFGQRTNTSKWIISMIKENSVQDNDGSDLAIDRTIHMQAEPEPVDN